MAITGPALFGKSVEKMLLNTLPDSLDSEDHKGALFPDSLAATLANIDAWDFWNDVSGAEITGTGYTSGGNTITGTVITVGSPAAGQIRYDITSTPSWPTSTINAAMGHLGYDPTVGTAAANPLWWLQDFVTAVSSSNGTLSITIHGDGVFYIDYTTATA